jgi:hypothetical protein
MMSSGFLKWLMMLCLIVPLGLAGCNDAPLYPGGDREVYEDDEYPEDDYDQEWPAEDAPAGSGRR